MSLFLYFIELNSKGGKFGTWAWSNWSISSRCCLIWEPKPWDNRDKKAEEWDLCCWDSFWWSCSLCCCWKCWSSKDKRRPVDTTLFCCWWWLWSWERWTSCGGWDCKENWSITLEAAVIVLLPTPGSSLPLFRELVLLLLLLPATMSWHDMLLMIVLEILLSLIYVFESFDACFDCIFWLLIVVDDCYVYVLRVLLLTILNTYVFKRKIVRLYENSMFLGSSNQLLLSVIDYHRAGPAIDY